MENAHICRVVSAAIIVVIIDSLWPITLRTISFASFEIFPHARTVTPQISVPLCMFIKSQNAIFRKTDCAGAKNWVKEVAQ